LEYIDEDQIPVRYGGSGQVVPGPIGLSNVDKGWSQELIDAYLDQDIYISSPQTQEDLPMYS